MSVINTTGVLEARATNTQAHTKERPGEDREEVARGEKAWSQTCGLQD